MAVIYKYIGDILPRKRVPRERPGKTEYKIYEGVRCALVILPVRIRKEANVGAGDYVSFEYDSTNDVIILKPRRRLSE